MPWNWSKQSSIYYEKDIFSYRCFHAFISKSFCYLENCPTSISKIGLFKFASSSKSAREEVSDRFLSCFSFSFLFVPPDWSAGLNILTTPVNDPVMMRFVLVPVRCLKGWMARLLEEYNSSGPAPESKLHHSFDLNNDIFYWIYHQRPNFLLRN